MEVENQGSLQNTTETEGKKKNKEVSGFWRRFLAFVIDGILLGFIGIISGLLLYDFFASLGGWGRALGFTISLLYFGVLNSTIASGQTLGKKICKIKVIDRTGNYISVPQSMARYSIIGLPYFLNGAMFPPDLLTTLWSTVLSLIVFGLGGSIFYLIVFNKKTRQSLHDLVLGTYVVPASKNVPHPSAPIWKGHFAIVTALCLVALLAPTIMMKFVGQKGPFP